MTTRALDRLDPMSVATQPGGCARQSSVAGQPLVALAPPPPITDPAVVRRITALLGPMAEWGVESFVGAPVDEPSMVRRDLAGRASNRPRALVVARRMAG
jgi:hypothetical protein